MRILHILDHSLPLQSGYVFRTMSILEHQQRLGWETFPLTTPRYCSSPDKSEMVDGCTFYRSPPVEGIAARLPIIKDLAEMRTTTKTLDTLIAELRPDILHAHSPILNAFPTLRAGKRHGIPVVYEVRALWEDGAVDHGTSTTFSPKYKLSQYLETLAVRRADAVTTICMGLRQEIIGRGGVPEDKVTVIPNGVTISRFSADIRPDQAVIDRLNLGGKRVIGFIGSFYRYEGLALLLDSFAGVHRDMPEARLLLVGGGFEDERLRRQAAELGVGDAIIFTGRVPNEDVESYYSVLEALVYPRLQTRLTELVTPLKPLEAMAMGKLVIASDVGGHKEIVKDKQTGLMFPAGDTAALAATITEALRNQDQMEKVQLAARKYIEEERNWADSVARYKPVYERLTGKST